jgi:Domain of unknown function (DUF4398)
LISRHFIQQTGQTMQTLDQHHWHHDPHGVGGRAVQLLAITATAWLLVACASTPPPNDQIAVANAAVVHAANAGAPNAAPGEMRMARDKLDRAKQAMTTNDYDLARTLAQQAQVDAQLAEAKADAIKAGQAAREVQDGNRVLREEIERNNKP